MSLRETESNIEVHNIDSIISTCRERTWTCRFGEMFQLLQDVSQGTLLQRSGYMVTGCLRRDLCLQDKAVRRFTVRNMIESAAIRDLSEASVYPGKSQ